MDKKCEAPPKRLINQPKDPPKSRESQPVEEKGKALSIITSIEEHSLEKEGFRSLLILVSKVRKYLIGLDLAIIPTFVSTLQTPLI